MFSTNAAGLKFKLQSLKNEIKRVNASIFTVQETHFAKKGKVKIENYSIFEAIRSKHNGGTMIGIHNSLCPMLISDYNDDFELLVVEIKAGQKEVRIISGYGPQECWNESERLPFFLALEKEILKAELQGKSIIIEMDSNSKLGKDFIPEDPHNQTPNGKLLAEIVQKHGLVVTNGVEDKVTGAITRRRVTKDSVEESIIDHVMISADLVDDFESLVVDEERNHVLTKLSKTKAGVVKKESDHNALISKFNFKWNKRIKTKRIEMYNLKNFECQKKFKEITNSSESHLSEIFDNEEDLNKGTKQFMKRLDDIIKKCFKKIRIKDRPNKELEELFRKRNILKNKTDLKSLSELKEIEVKLADYCAEINYNKIKEEISYIKCEEGGIHSGNLWKLKKKLNPKSRDPPTAMKDKEGNLVTSPNLIENIALEVFKDRLKNRPIRDGLNKMKEDKEELCYSRLKSAGRNKTPPWTMDQLETVLKYLKRNKSRDPYGYANDIFKDDVAGDDLKLAILKLCNRIKAEQHFPESLENADISSIYKNKGKRNEFNSYRGVFRVPIIRTILDRLIYNDEYDTIDESLSDSNVGARKGRNIRDNVFVLNAVMNSIINGKEEAVDVSIFDVDKCFDAMWVEECINDLYDAGFNNDKLPLLFLENQNANIAIKTVNGTSKRVSVKNIIMQGTVWGSLCCTASMDKLGQLVYNDRDLIYKYKGEVDIPTLGMVDDVLCIQKCSEDTVKMNAAVNAFIESKKLTLSETKCHRIHIERKPNKPVECQQLKVHDKVMEDSTREKYLGDILDNSGKIRATIEERRAKGFGIVNEILAILEEIPLGRYRMEIGLSLRKAMLLNGILYNSEAWHAVTDKELKGLEGVDEHLLRSLVHGHSKTPLEFIYLETGAIPIRYVISCRRMIYLQTILKRSNEELTKRVFEAQKQSATKGDYFELVKEDFENIGEELNEEEIIATPVQAFKRSIKEKTKLAALQYLQNKQSIHSKVKGIKYSTLETQGYITSPLFSDSEVSLLFAMRSMCVRECKANFSSQYRSTQEVYCTLCTEQKPDDQKHVLQCKVLSDQLKSDEMVINKISYDDIFKGPTNQKNITSLFSKLLEIKKKSGSTNPSTLHCQALKTSYDLPLCIVN